MPFTHSHKDKLQAFLACSLEVRKCFFFPERLGLIGTWLNSVTGSGRTCGMEE